MRPNRFMSLSASACVLIAAAGCHRGNTQVRRDDPSIARSGNQYEYARSNNNRYRQYSGEPVETRWTNDTGAWGEIYTGSNYRASQFEGQPENTNDSGASSVRTANTGMHAANRDSVQYQDQTRHSRVDTQTSSNEQNRTNDRARSADREEHANSPNVYYRPPSAWRDASGGWPKNASSGNDNDRWNTHNGQNMRGDGARSASMDQQTDSRMTGIAQGRMSTGRSGDALNATPRNDSASRNSNASDSMHYDEADRDQTRNNQQGGDPRRNDWDRKYDSADAASRDRSGDQPRSNVQGYTSNDRASGADRQANQPAPRANPWNDMSDQELSQHILSFLQEKNAEEIEIGKLAQEKADSPSAKQLASALVDDHTRSQTQTQHLAERLTVKIEKNKDKMERLKSLSGAEFDREFGRMMAKGHAKVIDKVREARDRTNNSELRSFLDEQLQALERHEQLARQINPNASARE